MRIGYIGLGQAGWPMSEKLIAAGHELVVHDADAERERRYVAEHACAGAGTIAGLAGVEAVICMLPNGDIVREVLLGIDGGLCGHLDPGTIVIDTSSADPFGTRVLGAALAERGIVLIDAPVTRPRPGNDELTIMVGGDEAAAVERAMPLLEAMAARVFRVGGLGCGHATKTLNNFVAVAGLIAALDALMIGHRFGLDPATTLEVFNVGTAHNFSTESVLGQESLTRRYRSGFQLALMAKDLGICAHLTEETGFETSLPAYLRDTLRRALADMDDEHADHAAALIHWEKRAGAQLPGASEAL